MKDKDNNYWKAKLDDQSYKVLREAATEIPFSGKYNLHFKDGHYRCKGCDIVLFDSSSKFDSGCGWPSFDRAKKGSIKYKESEGSIHKIAAKIMGAESYNGWTYWHYNLNGSTVVIDSLRQKFIAEKQN